MQRPTFYENQNIVIPARTSRVCQKMWEGVSDKLGHSCNVSLYLKTFTEFHTHETRSSKLIANQVHTRVVELLSFDLRNAAARQVGSK